MLVAFVSLIQLSIFHFNFKTANYTKRHIKPTASGRNIADTNNFVLYVMFEFFKYLSLKSSVGIKLKNLIYVSNAYL